jgi:NAD(P)-dependent dehydrogenase (short-subunit alcohol dehydrogenase family)
LGRTPKKLENTVDKINALGGKAFPLVADVLDENNLKTAREETLHRYGRIDILINSAGGNLPGATIMPEQSFFDLSIEDFDKVNTLNFQRQLTAIPHFWGDHGQAAKRSNHQHFFYGCSKTVDSCSGLFCSQSSY